MAYRTPPPCRATVAAALIGATMLLAPLTGARADSVAPLHLAQAAAPTAPAAAPGSGAASGATDATTETVEQRITTLRAALKITPDQDAKWQAVAQAMRQNAAAMEKLIAASSSRPQASVTAVDDLQLYQTFAQAHVDGLKNLLDDFKLLYAAMPEAQKKIADEVFRSAGE